MKKYLFVALMLAVSVLAVFLYAGQSPKVNVPTLNAAAVDYFLKIEGIEGESTDPGHPRSIELDSYQWGLGHSSSAVGAGGGTLDIHDLSFTTEVNKASPNLMLAAAKGTHYPKAELFVRRPGKQPQEYLKVTLEDVIITSYQTGGSGDSVPTDNVSLNFNKIEYEYKTQDAKGTPGQTIKTIWDLKAGGGT